MHRGSWRAPLWLVALMLLAGLATAHAQLVINELLADPASDWNGDGSLDTKLDEWVEVYNPGPGDAHLTEYWLRDGLGDTPHLNLFGVLAAGETAVFYGHQAVAWQQENGAGSSGLSLNNDGDTVELLRTNADVPDQLDVVDSYTYVAHAALDDRACGRLPDGGAWALFDGLNPYEGDLEPVGTGCLPTPGALNDCASGTAAEARNWSAVKGIFN
ncbi:MAG: lamin tail domain-containing protein [Candidatus Krumholzibacteriia bacterium]